MDYNSKNYTEQGGERTVIGGTLEIGGTLDIKEGASVSGLPSSSLPEVSGADNGKILTVVSGEWTAAHASSLPFIFFDMECITDSSTGRSTFHVEASLETLYNNMVNGKIILLRNHANGGTTHTVLTLSFAQDARDNGRNIRIMGHSAGNTLECDGVQDEQGRAVFSFI